MPPTIAENRGDENEGGCGVGGQVQRVCAGPGGLPGFDGCSDGLDNIVVTLFVGVVADGGQGQERSGVDSLGRQGPRLVETASGGRGDDEATGGGGGVEAPVGADQSGDQFAEGDAGGDGHVDLFGAVSDGDRYERLGVGLGCGGHGSSDGDLARSGVSDAQPRV